MEQNQVTREEFEQLRDNFNELVNRLDGSNLKKVLEFSDLELFNDEDSEDELKEETF